jgi:DNA-directed RNA polymerase subunit RPC12/RpoP
MPNQQMQMQPQYQNTLSTGYHCPYCNSNALPIVVKKVSAAGWAVFTVLLITTFILFWIGLLIQEERRICPSCNMRIS